METKLALISDQFKNPIYPNNMYIKKSKSNYGGKTNPNIKGVNIHSLMMINAYKPKQRQQRQLYKRLIENIHPFLSVILP